jgi:hypothetical protein
MSNRRLWIGILISLITVFLSVRGIDWAGLRDTLSQVRWVWLLPTSLLLVIAMVGRAVRWRLLFHPLEHLSLKRLFNILNIGYMLNNVLPVRLGDVARAYLCTEFDGIPVSRALSTVVVERVADVFTIVLLLVLILPSTPVPASVVGSARGAGLFALVAGTLLVFLVLRRESSMRLLDPLIGRLPDAMGSWLRQNLEAALEGLMALGTWRGMLAILISSLAIWLCAGLQFWMCFPAVGLSLPLGAALAVLCVTSLGMVVPSSPGYIGVFEYLTVVALGAFAVPSETALGYALVLHGSMYLAVIALGLVGVAAEGLSYARLRTAVSSRGPQSLAT